MTSRKAPKTPETARAGKRVTVTTRTEETGDEDRDDAQVLDDVEDDPGLASVDAMMNEIEDREGVYVNVYRLAGQGQKTTGFCFRADPQSDDMGDLLTRIQNEYGAGDYSIVARNRVGIIARQRVTIQAPRIPLPVPGVAPSADLAASIAAAITAANKPLTDAVSALLSRPAPDPMNLVTVGLGILEKIKPLFTPATPPVAPGDVFSQFENMLKLKDMMGALGGDGQPRSAMGEMVEMFKVFGGPLLEALKQGQLAAPSAQLTLPGVPGPGQPRPVPVAPGVQPAAPAAPLDPISAMVQRIAAYAQRGTAPEVAAREITQALDGPTVTEEEYDRALTFIEDENSVAAIMQNVPALAQSGGWLGTLRAEILKLNTADEEEPEPAA
jgi:hypothetical protein